MAHTRELELLVLLAILRLGDDAYGITILEELERQTSRTLTLGTVYKTLGRLEDKRYLRARIRAPAPETAKGRLLRGG